MNRLVKSPFRHSGYHNDFDHLLRGFFSPAHCDTSSVRDELAVPSMDVLETDKCFEVKADLPGVKKEDISINVRENVLTISATSIAESAEEEKKVIRQERRVGKYARSFKLGKMVDESAIRAEYDNGVLTLTLPKVDSDQEKEIAIPVH